VRELAAEGRVVIVGRGAWAILAGEPDALHVRVVAPRAYRAGQIAERLRTDPKAAQSLLARSDAERARYFQEYYGLDVDDPTHFDLVVNTARLGIEGAAALIVARALALGA
jgi:cytidylate kinase